MLPIKAFFNTAENDTKNSDPRIRVFMFKKTRYTPTMSFLTYMKEEE